MSDERERIVAWVRAEGDSRLPVAGAGEGRFLEQARWLECHRLANAIERGDHLVWKPEPTIPASEWTKESNLGH